MTRTSRNLVAILIGMMVAISTFTGITPNARAATTDWFAAARNAGYAFDYTANTVSSTKATLFALVDEAGTDTDALWLIMGGLDKAIGYPDDENQWSIEVIRDTEQRIADKFADMSLYSGTPTDAVWKAVSAVRTREIRAITADAAVLILNGKDFMGIKHGSATLAQSDYTLGLKRYRWSVSPQDLYTVPGSSQTMSVNLGSLPGSVKVGETLTVSPSFSVAPSLVSYVWTVECENGPRTSTGGSSYLVTNDDLGCGIIVDVSGSKAGYAPAEVSSFNVLGDVIPVKPAVTPPVDKVFSKTYTPTISGTTKVGKTLSAKVKSWSPKASFKYQWLRNGEAIAGATKSSYRLTAADLSKVISVAVTGTRSGYTAATKTSQLTKVVTPGTITKGKVKITGTRRVGKTLTASISKWTSGVTVAYQWYRNGVLLTGATAKTYTPSPTDKGKRFRVVVSATKDGYLPAGAKASARTSKIKTGYLTKATPTISGNAVVGETLTVSSGTWKPSETAFTYQWYRSGKKIAGATAASYVLTDKDKAKTIKVKVTGKAVGYYTGWRYSRTTAKVVSPTPPPPDPEPSPSPSPGSTP